MSKGKSESPLSLAARREKAIELFVRGYTNARVARELVISPDTAARYRSKYEAEIKRRARGNPQVVRDILANTIRTLEETEQVRMEAWAQYEKATTDATKQRYLALILSAQDQRAKLFGLFGVKAEYAMHVASVRDQQIKIVEFMQRHLCAADRILLENYLTEEFASELAEMPTAAGPNN